MFKYFTFWFQLITNATITSWKYLSAEDVNYYCEWLGPKESQEKEQLQEDFPQDGEAHPKGLRRVPKRGKGPVSTIICNHISWIEMMGLI